ncbi:MAG: type VI secretion system baseplate subunit TssE [Pyrinomonadaceae bacterium]
MARTDNEIRITPSVLDRLLDFEPNLSTEAPKSRSKSLRELKMSVRRDLEWLLNTRRFIEEIPENLEEINKSVAVYGLPDFTGASAKSSTEQKRLVKQIETAIKIFEPRFLDLKVTLEPSSNLERALRFRIDARLDLEPTPEPISFDTVFQYGSSEFSVTEK